VFAVVSAWAGRSTPRRLSGHGNERAARAFSTLAAGARSPRDRSGRPYADLMSRTYALVSPHLDDVPLSCARLLGANPGSHVVTVFAGGPASVSPLPDWDKQSLMFRDGDDVVAVRRLEDEASSALLRATSHHLRFWDSQYREPHYGYTGPSGDAALVDAIASDLVVLLGELAVDTWVMPLGLVHHDHELAAIACLTAFARAGGGDRLLYRELPYHREFPERVGPAEDRVRAHGYDLRSVEVELSPDTDLKHAAIHCHRSQVPQLSERTRPPRTRIEEATYGPEIYFRLVAADSSPR
jgi:LmbE family N-acetylglucosaminyl deacetylase